MSIWPVAVSVHPVLQHVELQKLRLRPISPCMAPGRPGIKIAAVNQLQGSIKLPGEKIRTAAVIGKCRQS